MIYSRSEILFEAENTAAMTKIGVLSDLMFENYLFEYELAEDEDTYTESVSGMVETAKKMVSTMIAKIKEFLSVKRQAFNEYVRKKNLRKMMSSDFRALLKKLEKQPLDKKYTTPDMLALKKISEKYTELIEKYVAEIELQISLLPRKGFGKEKAFDQRLKTINAYIEKMKKGVKALEEEAQNVRTVVLTPEMLYKYTEAGIRSEDDIVAIQQTVAKMEKKFNDIIETIKSEFQTEMESNAIYLRKKKRREQREKVAEQRAKNDARMKEIMKESAEEEGSSTGGFFGKIKSLISKAIASVNAFVHSHAKVLSIICRALSIIYGFATASRAAGTLTIGGLSAVMNNETVKSEILRQHPEISGQYGDAQHLVHTATGYNAVKTGGDALLTVGFGKASKKLKKIAEEEKKQKKEGEL